jgi:hypothetical protein
MEPITITGFDGHSYVVKAVKWMRKEEIRRSFTKIGREKFDFDQEGFNLSMLMESTTCDGKTLTMDNIADWDAKTGDMVRNSYVSLNVVTRDEERNLKPVPPSTTPKTP